MLHNMLGQIFDSTLGRLLTQPFAHFWHIFPFPKCVALLNKASAQWGSRLRASLPDALLWSALTLEPPMLVDAQVTRYLHSCAHTVHDVPPSRCLCQLYRKASLEDSKARRLIPFASLCFPLSNPRTPTSPSDRPTADPARPSSMGLRPFERGMVHSLARCSCLMKMLAEVAAKASEPLRLECSKAVLLDALVEVEAEMELTPIQEPVAVGRIDASLQRSSASIGGIPGLLLP